MLGLHNLPYRVYIGVDFSNAWADGGHFTFKPQQRLNIVLIQDWGVGTATYGKTVDRDSLEALFHMYFLKQNEHVPLSFQRKAWSSSSPGLN